MASEDQSSMYGGIGVSERLEKKLDDITLELRKVSDEILKFKPVTEAVSQLNRNMLGSNGSPGLIVRVDRLEQDTKRWRWVVTTLGSAFASAIVALAFKVMG